LERHYSTRELPLLCDPLPSLSFLRPGDLINTYNDHVMLFAGFEDHGDGKLRACVYQAGTDSEARVTRNAPTIEFLRTMGYQPMRYRGMKDEKRSIVKTPLHSGRDDQHRDSFGTEFLPVSL
jgi:hypothetical protein